MCDRNLTVSFRPSATGTQRQTVVNMMNKQFGGAASSIKSKDMDGNIENGFPFLPSRTAEITLRASIKIVSQFTKDLGHNLSASNAAQCTIR